MKILYWTNGFCPDIGGMETQALTYTQELQRRGHECIVISPEYEGVSYQNEQGRTIPVYRYPFKQVLDKKDTKSIADILRHIKKLILQLRPDVLHLNLGFGEHLFYYQLISKMFPIPVFVTIHGLALCPDHRLINLYHSILSSVDTISCVSKALLKEAETCTPNNTNTFCIYNGLPEPTIPPSNLSFTPAKIVCIGRLAEEKGFDIAIGAMHILSKKIRNVELIIAGDGDEREYLEKLTRSLRLERPVKFMGKMEREKVLELINTATIVLVPSQYEAFGLTALESMQMARPVIASRVGGLAEIIRHQDTGLLITRNNIDELVGAMEYLLGHPEAAIQMGQRAQADVANRFSIGRMADEYEKAYREVIKLKRKACELV